MQTGLLRAETRIDALTGERLDHNGDGAGEHAIPAGTTLHGPGGVRGLEGLPQGVTLAIDTLLDLQLFRLDRDARRNHDRPYAYTLPELEAALAHPDVTREQIVRGSDAPERGRRLALYDAIAQWIAYVRREWRDRAPGEPMAAPAHEVLDPVLLDFYAEYRVALSEQGREWVEGMAPRIPQSAAWEAERCLRAGLDSYTVALGHSLDDQLRVVAARESVPHRCPLAEPPPDPNSIQCGHRLLGPLYDGAIGHRVVWRATVDPASSTEHVRIELRSGASDVEAVAIEIDPICVGLVAAGAHTSFTHEGDSQRLGEIGEAVSEVVRNAITQSRVDAAQEP